MADINVLDPLDEALNYIDTEALSVEYEAMMERFYEKGGGTPRDSRTILDPIKAVSRWIDWAEEQGRSPTQPYYGRGSEGQMIKTSGIVPKSVIEDVYGGKQYVFSNEDLDKMNPRAMAFASRGKSFLPEDYPAYMHPYQQELLKIHEGSHARRQRGEGILRGGVDWHEQPEEQLAERESGEFMLRKAGLVGKYNPYQIMALQRFLLDRSGPVDKPHEWEENPDAPVSSVAFREPERSIREAVQERPIIPMSKGKRPYISREGSALPQLSSVVSREIPEDIREHWKLKAESIKNIIKMNPNVLLTEKGRNLLEDLRIYEKGYPSYYENVAEPLSKLDDEVYQDLR